MVLNRRGLRFMGRMWPCTIGKGGIRLCKLNGDIYARKRVRAHSFAAHARSDVVPALHCHRFNFSAHFSVPD